MSIVILHSKYRDINDNVVTINIDISLALPQLVSVLLSQPSAIDYPHHMLIPLVSMLMLLIAGQNPWGLLH